MPMSVVYATVNGRMVQENRGGTITKYVADTLGSVIQTRNASGVQTSSTTYWPYGEVRTSTGTNPSPWGFVGTLGYFRDALSRLYIRARYYIANIGRWSTVDPLWPDEDAYSPVDGKVTTLSDPDGKTPWRCERCALAMGAMYWGSPVHWCCHKFIHCLMCCTLAHEFGIDCALDMQLWQNEDNAKPGNKRARLTACGIGANSGVPTDQCEEHCKKAYPSCSKNARCSNPPTKPYRPNYGWLPPACAPRKFLCYFS